VILQVQHAHLAVNRRTTQAAKLSPRAFNDAVSAKVYRTIRVPSLYLKPDTLLTYHIGSEKVQISLKILVVALKITGSVAKIGERPTDFAVCTSITRPEISEKPPFTGGCVHALLLRLRRPLKQV
jgi:hypothetical protein